MTQTDQAPNGAGFGTLCACMAHRLAGLPRATARELDQAEPLTTQWVRLGGYHAERSVLLQVEPHHLAAPVRAAFVADVTDGIRMYGFAVRQAERRELRGQRVPFLSTMPTLRTTIAILRSVGPAEEWSSNFCTWHPREKRWHLWNSGHRDAAAEQFDRNVRLALGLQFSRRYDWTVEMSRKQGDPRVSLPTTAEEARELFAARELPEGAARRAALLHWVSAHYRSAPDGEVVPVREHLRGAREFDFGALHCELRPSAFDRERLARV